MASWLRPLPRSLDAATEHVEPDMPEILLSVDSPCQFTRMACARANGYLKSFRTAMSGSGQVQVWSVDVDSADSPVRFDWKSMVLTHPEAAKIIGPGIIKMEARFMDSHDPNWKNPIANLPVPNRLDFVAWRSDGSFCRLHPDKLPGDRHGWAISVRGQRNPSLGDLQAKTWRSRMRLRALTSPAQALRLRKILSPHPPTRHRVARILVSASKPIVASAGSTLMLCLTCRRRAMP